MNIIMTHPNVPESHSSSRITRPYLTSVKFFTKNNPSSIQQSTYITSSAKRQLWPSVVHLTYAIYWFAPNLKLPKVVHSVASCADVLRLVTRSSPRTSAQRTGHFRSLAVSLCFKRANPLFC